jgi:hypothetical protein
MATNITSSSVNDYYRGFEIYRDMHEDDEEIELDEIDIAHQAATAHPRIKSRIMNEDPALIGLPTYTQIVKDDMNNMLDFIQKESCTSVIEEFKKRNEISLKLSYDGLMAVELRYKQAALAVLQEDGRTGGGEVATHVSGINLGLNATKRQQKESKQIVHGLLAQPGLIQSKFRNGHDARGFGLQKSSSNINNNNRNHNHNKQKMLYAELGVYDSIGLGANNSIWDGTVYKRTLIQSLFKKLRYKLYFDALKHEAIAKKNARLIVLSIVARRMTKMYALCFQSILAEFLCAKYICSHAELKTNLYLIQRVLWPVMDQLRRYRYNSLERKLNMNRVNRMYDLRSVRVVMHKLRRLRNRTAFAKLVLQLLKLTQRGKHFRTFLSLLKRSKVLNEILDKGDIAVEKMFIKRHIQNPFLSLSGRCKTLNEMNTCMSNGYVHWKTKLSRKVFHTWLATYRIDILQTRSNELAGWFERRKHANLTFTIWGDYTITRRRKRHAIKQVLKLLNNDQKHSAMTIWNKQRKLGYRISCSMDKARTIDWMKLAKRGLHAIRRHALLGQWSKRATKRADRFVNCIQHLEGFAGLKENASRSRRDRLAQQVGALGSQMRSQVQTLWALDTLRSVKLRDIALRQWAPEHAASTCASHAMAAWMFSYIRRSSMRAALERRVNSNEIVDSEHGTSAMQLQAGMNRLRDETMLKLVTSSRKHIRGLHRSLHRAYGACEHPPTAPLARERLAFVQDTLHNHIHGNDSAGDKEKSKSSIKRHLGVDGKQTKRSLHVVRRRWTLFDEQEDDTEIDIAATTASKFRPAPIKISYGGVFQKTPYASWSSSSSVAPKVRKKVSLQLQHDSRTAEYVDSEDDDNADSKAKVFQSAPVSKTLLHQHSIYEGSDDDEDNGVGCETNKSQEQSSSLHRFFSHARSLPRPRKVVLEDDDAPVSNYLNISDSPQKKQVSVQQHPSASPIFKDGSGNHEGNDDGVVGVGMGTEEQLSVAFSSFSFDTSVVNGTILDRSFDISTRTGGLQKDGFLFAAITALPGKGLTYDGCRKIDDDKVKQDDIISSLDSATLLVQAAHWALHKLKRFSHLKVSHRKTFSLTCRKWTNTSMKAWKLTREKLQQTFALCHQVWSIGAKKRAIKQLHKWGVIRMRLLNLKVTEHVTTLRVRNTYKSWYRIFLLTSQENKVRRNTRYFYLSRHLKQWIWCKKHIPNVRRFQRKLDRRILYPCINHWRQKARNMRKLRRCFMFFETQWQKRWVIVYGRSIKSRMFECFDNWNDFVVIVKAERWTSQRLDRALLFRSVSLKARCYMGWLDFYLSKLKIKRAHMNRIHMIQRIFLRTIGDAAEIMRLKTNKSVAYYDNSLYKSKFNEWRQETYMHRYLLPQKYCQKRMMKVVWQHFKLEKRVRLYYNLLLPRQKLECLRKKFYAWHHIFSRKIKIDRGCTKLHNALMRMRVRGVMQTWPGRDSFQRAEKMRQFMDEKGRSKIVLVNVTEEENLIRKAAIEKKEKEERDRSFIQQRKAAPVERRAALLGFIYSADDPGAVETLLNVLRAVLYAWQDQAHTDASLRGMERLVRFRHKRALLFQMLRVWIGKCSMTTHRLALWISKKFAKHANKKLAMNKTGIATKHLVAQYSKLDLNEFIDIDN